MKKACLAATFAMLLLSTACWRLRSDGSRGDAGPAASTEVEPVVSKQPRTPVAVRAPQPLSGMAAPERKALLVSLLEGKKEAGGLPESSTDRGYSFDPGLRKRLTTVEVAVDPLAPYADPLTPPPALSEDVVVGAHTSDVPIPSADRVLAGLRPRLRACFSKKASSAPKVPARLFLRAKLSSTGAVTSAEVARNQGVAPEVAECAESVLKAAKFEPPGPKGATLTFSVVSARIQ